MLHKHLLRALTLAILITACTTKKESTLTYPAVVVAAHQQAHYRTALWCVYTSHLNSSVLEQNASSDSIRARCRQLLAAQRHFRLLESKGACTCFRFALDFTSPAQRSLLKRLMYDSDSRQLNKLSPIAAVWVNNQSGIIDSVLTYEGIRYWAGPIKKQVNGKWVTVAPADSRKLPYNLDEPCKVAFLQQHQEQLNTELRQLCQEKGIVPH